MLGDDLHAMKERLSQEKKYGIVGYKIKRAVNNFLATTLCLTPFIIGVGAFTYEISKNVQNQRNGIYANDTTSTIATQENSSYNFETKKAKLDSAYQVQLDSLSEAYKSKLEKITQE